MTAVGRGCVETRLLISLWWSRPELTVLALQSREGNLGPSPERPWQAPLGAQQSHRFHRLVHPEQVDDSLEVVGEHLQAHLGAHILQSAREEVRRPHPLLQSSEHMLDGTSA